MTENAAMKLQIISFLIIYDSTHATVLDNIKLILYYPCTGLI